MSPVKTPPVPRRIGPFTVSAVNATDDFIPLVTLPAGTTVLLAWAYGVTDLVTNPPADGHQVYVSLGQGSGSLVAYPDVPSDLNAGREVAVPISRMVATVPTSGASLSVELYPAGGSFTAGAIEVYALVLDPA